EITINTEAHRIPAINFSSKWLRKMAPNKNYFRNTRSFHPHTTMLYDFSKLNHKLKITQESAG
ncbi:hypothetical protein ABPD29_05385, partial [Secundilactobacillus paracollinoides]|uniref:hypothetical protein n=1 Tax=Secundilactobacillus paracollinoides TaxID=240427 RepID=UPI003F47EF6E